MKHRILLSVLLIAALLILYLPLARYSFVQDDWTLMNSFAFHDTPSLLAGIFAPAGKYFYRPLGNLYCLLVYTLFGLNPVAFHLLSVVILGAAAFLVVRIARAITMDERVAWGSGFLFVGASNIQIDPQMWLVGAYDLGAGLLVLLSLDAFIRRRFTLSALWFAASLGFKESAGMLLFVLAAWTALTEKGWDKPSLTVREAFGRLKWHALGFLVLAALKLPGISLFALPESHPYASRLIGRHLITNGEMFGAWALQAMLPLKNITFSGNGSLMALLGVSALVLLVFFGGIRHARRTGTDVGAPTRDALFVLIWFALLLLPALTLKNHFNRYYLAMALPPLAIGALLTVKYAVRAAGGIPRVVLYACVVFASANLIDGGVSLQRRISLGLNDGRHTTEREGDNNFIRKASLVAAVWKPLIAILPSLPPCSLLVLEGVETGCIANSNGLQVIYGDSTLTLTNSSPGEPDSAGMVRATVAREDALNSHTESVVSAFPASRVVHVQWTDSGMVLLKQPSVPE